MNCLPDTGCTQSVISADLATAIGAIVDTTAQVNLLTANGGNITVLGQAQLYMQLRDKTTTTFVIVAQNVSHSALISWHDLQQLGVIPKTFPQVNACSSAASDALKAKTVSKFVRTNVRHPSSYTFEGKFPTISNISGPPNSVAFQGTG